MLKRVTFLLTLFLLLCVLHVYSQTINITPAVIDTICPGNSVSLVAHVAGSGYGTDSYSFQVVPYHVEPFVNDTAVDPDFGSNTDDAIAGPYPIGFEFCFLNQHYTQYWIGSNGWISFTQPLSSWTNYTPDTLPNNGSNVPKNVIFGPWQDWWPHHSPPGVNNVFRHIETDSVDSKLVVYWNNCPMYGCYGGGGPLGGLPPVGTFQIVLHQQSSIIENNITRKDACSSWQNNSATQGVQNIDGTLAYIAFHRNQNSWTTYNESTRFVPSGVSWYKDTYPGGAMVGQGDSIILKPLVTTTYFAVVNTCINGTATASVVIPVFPSVVPSISGNPDVCMNNTEKYMTDSGMKKYTWTVTNGTIISGGTNTDDSVMVKWDNPIPPHNVSISYTDLNGCRPLSPTIINVNVNAFITPVITGVNSLCAGSQATYTTQAGNTNYLWTYPGATLISGGTTNDNTITLSWPLANTYTISVNYTSPVGCTSNPPTSKSIFVNPIPIPSFTGLAITCLGSTQTYTTDPGMTGYSWTISAGGTINSGQGSNSISVTWNNLGNQSLNVGYTDSQGCSTNNPPPYNVTVIPLPLPTISGSLSNCKGSAGNNFTTEVGMTGYNWTVTPDGIITSGSATSTIQVTWATAGTKTVSVNYINPGGCTALSPATFTVTVNDLPAPTIIGNTGVCQGTTGTLYSTQPGMTNYSWTLSGGGTITSGGTAADNTVTVTWNTAGAQTISVNYNDANNCSATAPVVYPVTVYPLPVPTVAGPAGFCVGVPGAVYSTQPGMTNYQWTVSGGGTITTGGTPADNSVTITWNTPGPQTVTVNYQDANGCTAVSSTLHNVIINALPVPAITGPASVCLNSSGTYSTAAGMTNYSWTVSPGGTITSGGTASDPTITITWNTTGSKSIGINYTDLNGCTAVSASVFPVTVNPLPVPVISGTNLLCAGTTGTIYSTQPGMSNYIWTISAGGTITSGGTITDNTVTVTWNTAGAQTVSVNYINANTCTAASPVSYPVTVQPLPVPVISGLNMLCQGTSGVIYSTQPGMTNYLWTVSAGGSITAGGTGSDHTITVTWNSPGTQSVSVNFRDINSCTALAPVSYPVTVNALPVPSISGPTSVCQNSTAIYFTDAGMTNYIWSVSLGGIITAGNGTSNITVLWNTNGAKTITVNYTDVNNCSAASPSTYPVNVSDLPVPSLNGTNIVCKGNSAIYSTDAGMSGYSWTVSSGGTITAGGSSSDNTATINWNTPGAQSISVNYQAGPGCMATVPTLFPVTVKPIPSVTNAANSSVCSATTLNIIPQADLPGTLFSWTATGSSGNVSGYNSGSGVMISDHLVNAGFNIETVTYVVLPSLNGCDGGNSSFIVTVNPVADVTFTPNGQTFCSGGTTNISLGSHVTGTTFTWSASGSSGTVSGFGPGAGNTISQTLTNTGINNETATYHVLPAANTCQGMSSDVVITIMPLPSVAFTPCTDITTTTDAKPFTLKGGTPLGGTYSGTGANSGIFYPSLAGTGMHNILYSYTNINGCSSNASLNISVLTAFSFTCDNPLTDVRDNTSYPTIKIGTQCWMAVNLNFGNTVPSSSMQRDNCLVEKYCFNDNAANCSSLGGLYQWDEMMQFNDLEGIQGLCPPAWHIPAENEWTTLFNFFTSNGFAGSPLKSTGYSGFNALLTGIHFDNVNWNFSNFAAFFWSSTSDGATRAWAHSMNTINPSVSYYPGNRSNAFSVRCIKD